MKTADGTPDRPAVRGEPFYYMVASLLGAFVIDRFIYSLPFQPRWIGWGFVGFSIAGSLICHQQFRRIGEDANTWTSNAIVKSGPYRFSRNPMYVLMLVLQGGISMLIGTWWGIIMLLPTWLMFKFWVVLPEEAYLERRLGQEYLDYKDAVRRWI
jgi:protein-S-isoprenylcysteine O-methyltransferase Ste14